MVLNAEITSTSATARQSDYTASNGDAKIDQITVNNTDGSTHDVYFCIASDAVLTGSLPFIEMISVAPNTETQIPLPIGHVVPLNGSIQYYAGSATGIYITVSGVEKLNN